MAECQSEKKPAAAAPSSSGFDLYGGGGGGGVFNAKMMQQVGAAGGTTATVTTGKIDRFQGWSRYNKDNQAATAETRISSFSKEDSFTYSSIYSNHGFPREKNPQLGSLVVVLAAAAASLEMVLHVKVGEELVLEVVCLH
jgi:hypothetical protein